MSIGPESFLKLLTQSSAADTIIFPRTSPCAEFFDPLRVGMLRACKINAGGRTPGGKKQHYEEND
jgi:hypothetical protein